LGVTVAYSRNAWKNQQAVVNRALGVADFSSYCITAPTDTRLGNFGGNQVCGLYDENPAKFGQRTAERVQWQDVSSGNREPTEVFNGIDVAINALSVKEACCWAVSPLAAPRSTTAGRTICPT
jgi:hypothetical protein